MKIKLQTILSVFFAAFLLMPVSVSAQTLDELERELLQLQGQYQEMLLKVGREENYTVSNTTGVGRPVDMKCTKLEGTLRYQMVDHAGNEPIKALQNFLKVNGDYTYPSATGFFGEETQRSVARFQQRVGLIPAEGYGVVDATTRNRIEDISCSQDKLQINPLVLPSTVAGNYYNTVLSVENATGNVTYYIKNGSLPRGIAMTNSNNQAILSGRTYNPGVYSFTVKAINGADETERAYVLISNDKDGALFGP